ncbi:MAG: organomercurial lyase [Alphaproteobacteria bacterium]|nr:organomercurial lyase [Alphaproteobacteria bacterium]
MPVPHEISRNSIGAFLSEEYLAENTAGNQRLSVAAYRLLARGSAVSTADLAKALTKAEAHVSTLLDLLPPSVLDRDADGRITAFIGLSLAPTAHSFTIGAQKLYTWCVLDALFLPEILGERASVATICPASGQAINLELTPTRIVAERPAGVVMSVVAPDAQSCRENLRGAFCSHVNLFAGANIFDDWAKARPGVAYIPLVEAFDLARMRNRERYPDIDLRVHVI